MFEIDFFGGMLLLSVPILLFFGMIIWHCVSTHKNNKRLLAEMDKYADGPELDEIGARIIAKACSTRTYGTKTTQMRREFTVTFRTDMGEERRFSVQEEFYLSVDEGDEGTLATLNGNFYGFDKD